MVIAKPVSDNSPIYFVSNTTVWNDFKNTENRFLHIGGEAVSSDSNFINFLLSELDTPTSTVQIGTQIKW